MPQRRFPAFGLEDPGQAGVSYGGRLPMDQLYYNGSFHPQEVPDPTYGQPQPNTHSESLLSQSQSQASSHTLSTVEAEAEPELPSQQSTESSSTQMQLLL